MPRKPHARHENDTLDQESYPMHTTPSASRCPGPIADVQRRSFLAGGLGGLLGMAIPWWQARAAATAATPSRHPKA
ncbi:MAG TPA: hypothetical protein VHY20_05190, partial [Pirellulales bacterium]|nr:hypothetical protein [Pirellulales bacterium]